MYIKEIKLYGFKSFADKTIIELNKSFTGIVGPNGSGKSNIVDAVKWVLGEQSIKSLRGENNMSDVIFCGSASRNPSNSAYVSILFDNTDRSLATDYEEVEIKRVVYKTGENEYYINNNQCRLKDIINLLIDQMSSKESLNIVPQKKVDQILSEKSEDRRVIFEDAAGVLKYKNRKMECLRKLDRTHDNMSRVDMIIDEISKSLVPLERDSIKAREYKNTLSELENVEVALIVKDVTTASSEVEIKNKKKDELESELIKVNSSIAGEEVNNEKIKNKIYALDEDIRKTSEELISINNELTSLSNKKILMSERNKYDKNSNEVINNIASLKDKIAAYNSEYKVLEEDINSLNNIKSDITSKLNTLNIELNNLEITTNTIRSKYNDLCTRKIETTSKIEILTNNINNSSKVPYAVRNVVGNPTLRGIHNIICNLVETKSDYSTMLEVALGASAFNIVVDDETCAKEAIEHLKKYNKGRCTFFPLNVIKPKSIDPSYIKEIKDIDGFIGIACDLVTYDNKYYNIVMNTLGNIIVARDINSATYISKKVNRLYRVVSLDGELVHVGGSLTGGSLKSNNSYITDKYEKDKLEIELENIVKEIKETLDNLNKSNNELNLYKDNIFKLNIKSSNINEKINSKKNTLNNINNEIESLTLEVNNLSKNDNIDSELDELIKEYHDKDSIKVIHENKMKMLNDNKIELNKDLEVSSSTIKKLNTESYALQSEINTLGIETTKLNTMLDNLLNRLNEDYSLTYERAKSTYTLEVPILEARDMVTNLRRKIKSLGEVNLGSIEEYERLSTRVNFLNKQKEDLEKSEKDILLIINDLDNIMKEKFTETFNNINVEFNKVFKSLFHGGEAHLKLTNPDDMLNTGVDIIAVPSGKSLKPLSLLSGGERTLTAISLLFAIMNLKNVPFVILDEVESDLDDNNVSVFCEYLKNYRNKTQLLIITHKKKTMEYLDTLYGVTMQESGVSKLVSVKLEDN